MGQIIFQLRLSDFGRSPRRASDSFAHLVRLDLAENRRLDATVRKIKAEAVVS